MEVKIGVQHAQRELLIDSDLSAEEIQEQLAQALSGDGLLRLNDTKGRSVAVPAAKIAYLEFGSPTAGTVGFR